MTDDSTLPAAGTHKTGPGWRLVLLVGFCALFLVVLMQIVRLLELRNRLEPEQEHAESLPRAVTPHAERNESAHRRQSGEEETDSGNHSPETDAPYLVPTDQMYRDF